MATVAGVFGSHEQVNQITGKLKEMGFDEKAVSIVVPHNYPSGAVQESTSRAPDQEGSENKQGVLVTVVAEGDWVEKVRSALEANGATHVEVRYSLWDRGSVMDYMEATDEQREKRSGSEKNKNHQDPPA